MCRPAGRIAVLVLTLLAGMFAGLPHARGDPFHLQIANETLASPDGVDVDNWIAQSFLPGSSFFVSRTSLYVSDVGVSDVLAVSIRADAAGAPAGMNLTQGSVDGPAGAGWVDLDLSPYVELLAGLRYWIVARSTAPLGQGYNWWDSGTNLAYPDGAGVKSSDGSTWTPRGKDYAFRIYGFVQPGFAFSASVSSPSVAPAQSAVFRVNFTNAGPGSAAFLWVNVSLPGEVRYVSDDAATIGGVRTGQNRFWFANVVPGVYSFNYTTSARGGVANGTVVVTRFTFEPTDHNGVRLTGSIVDVPIVIRNARLTVSLVSSASVVDPGDLISLNATVANVGLEPGMNLLIEAPLDANASYVSSSAWSTYDVPTRTVRRIVSALDPGLQTSLEWTVRVVPGTQDFTPVASLARVSYWDGTGTPLASEEASTTARVQAPVFAPVLRLDRTAAQRGDEIVATLYYNNTGSTAALGAWANWSLGGNFALVSLSPAVPSVPLPSGFGVAWTNVPPGPRFVSARLRVVRGLVDALAMGLQVDWSATDGNGNPLPRPSLTGAVDLLAPSVSLALAPPNARIDTGTLFTLSLAIRNTGRAPASGWLNLTLPAGVAYVDDNGTFAATPSAGRISWTIALLPAGSSTLLGITLQAGGDPGTASFRFSLNLTDGRGSPPVPVFSNAVSLDIVGTAPAAGTPAWWWIGLGAVGLVSILVVVRRHRSSDVSVEDVFVADRSGVLLAHRASTVVPYEDEDVLIGMFKVVQDFVHDAFSQGTSEEMHSLEFGDRKILIERGRQHFLTVVYRGHDRGTLAERVRRISQQIDDRFGDTIANWTGDMEAVRGITLLLPSVWKRKAPLG